MQCLGIWKALFGDRNEMLMLYSPMLFQLSQRGASSRQSQLSLLPLLMPSDEPNLYGASAEHPGKHFGLLCSRWTSEHPELCTPVRGNRSRLILLQVFLFCLVALPHLKFGILIENKTIDKEENYVMPWSHVQCVFTWTKTFRNHVNVWEINSMVIRFTEWCIPSYQWTSSLDVVKLKTCLNHLL